MAYGDVDPHGTADAPPPAARPPAAPPPANPPAAEGSDPAQQPGPSTEDVQPAAEADAAVAAAPPVEVPPKRRRGLLVSLVIIVVAALIAVPATIVLTSGGSDTPATAALPSPTGSPTASPAGPPASPKPGDPSYVRFAWAKAQINGSLRAMSVALREGDLAAFVKPAATRQMRAELERRFRSLRAMKVTNVELTADSGPFDDKLVGGYAEWGVGVAVNHCFVVPTCTTEKLLVETAWRDSPAGYKLVKFSTVTNANGPQPWEVGALTAAVGSRAMVVAPKALSGRARAFLPAADRAAKIADRYVLGKKPDRYIVYLAGPSDWKKWFGGSEDWAIGFAVPATDERSDIVLRAEEISGGYAEDVMKHEMGHVATLSGRDYRDYNGENWWLTEGIAEYVEWDGRSVSSYDRKQNARRLLREKKFTGNLEKLVPDDDAPDWRIDGSYGLGYYATKCIADQYGHAKMLRFADAVLRGGRPSEAEAPPILGTSWKTVSTRCLAYTKQKLGV